MELRLDGLNITVENPYVEENDVFVDFEYDEGDENELKFFLKVFVGRKDADCRFSMKIIYLVNLENEIFDDDYIMIKKSIQIISQSLIEVILILDNLIKKPKERLH